MEKIYPIRNDVIQAPACGRSPAQWRAFSAILSLPKKPTAQQVSKYVLDIATQNSTQARLDLYKVLLQDEILSFLDRALEYLVSSIQGPTAELHYFAVSLAKTAPDRGPVKFAIALLGIMGDARDVELVARLGLHEEFTLFTTIALTNLLAEPEYRLWDLAKKVDGWGKIHVVKMLASTRSKEIQDWLLRDGYRNVIMDEYLAYDCAVGGELRRALDALEVEDELFRSAGEIIHALLRGGPANDIRDYADAADGILRYLQLLDQRAGEIEQYLTVSSILEYPTHAWDMDARAANGWTGEKRERAILLAHLLLQNPCGGQWSQGTCTPPMNKHSPRPPGQPIDQEWAPGISTGRASKRSRQIVGDSMLL
jgi:hypothetical protein